MSSEKMMLESAVENYLKSQTEKRGGLCFKLESPGNNGMPDRVVVIPPFGRVIFVETKRPKTGRLEELQKYQTRKLRERGAIVYVLSDKDAVDQFIDWEFGL